jgi:hypothetical protein
MKKYSKKELLEDFNVYKYINKFDLDNNKVMIIIEQDNNDKNKLDLSKFYSRVAMPGYARCSLYFMLKDIIENISNYNRETEIGISIIAPSQPRRNMESIKKTYNNIGFKRIICNKIKGMSEEELDELFEKYPDLSDARELFAKDSELCYADFEKIGNILDTLKFCEDNLKRNREYSDSELLNYTKSDNEVFYTDEELLNFDTDIYSKKQKAGKNKKHIKTIKMKNNKNIKQKKYKSKKRCNNYV